MSEKRGAPDRALLTGYESLRAYVLSPSKTHSGIQGLALVLRRGLAAWILAFLDVSPPRSPEPPTRQSISEPLPTTFAQQVAMLLTSMALKTLTEVQR